MKKNMDFLCNACLLEKKHYTLFYNFLGPQNEGLPNAYVPGSLVRDPRGLFTMALRSRIARGSGSVAWVCRSEDAEYEIVFAHDSAFFLRYKHKEKVKCQSQVCFMAKWTPPGPVTKCLLCMTSKVSVGVLWLTSISVFFLTKSSNMEKISVLSIAGSGDEEVWLGSADLQMLGMG